MLLDTIQDHSAQDLARQGVGETRRCRQRSSPHAYCRRASSVVSADDILYLLFRERMARDGGHLAVMALAKFMHSPFESLRNQNSGRIVIAELVDEIFFASLGSAINVSETIVHLGQRRHALGNDNRHVIVAGGIPENASQRSFLDMDFDVDIALAHRRSAIKLRRVGDGVGRIVERLRLVCDATQIDDAFKWDLAPTCACPVSNRITVR